MSPSRFHQLIWSLSSHHVSGKAIVVSKLTALFTVYWVAPWGWWGPVIHDADWMLWFRKWTSLNLYLAVFAIALAGVCVLPFLRDWRIRVPLATFFLLGFLADQVVLAFTGQHLTTEMAAIAIREHALAGGFMRTFGGTIGSKSLLVGSVAVAFFLPPGKVWALPSRTCIIPLVALVFVATLLVKSEGKMDAFPSPYSVPAQLLASQLLATSADGAQRAQVTFTGTLISRSRVKKIVMVVDESVRGDYLGLNIAKYDNTPFLSKASGALANYGVAISGVNCSAASRLFMRVGLQKHQLPDINQLWRELPTIWQYARKAEFKTILIDTWNRFGVFHSYMSTEEARQINEFITILDQPYYTRDAMAADKLIEVLKRDEPMFIYVNKYGTHMPYSDNFPPDLNYDPAPLVVSLPLNESRRSAVRDYHKAIRWSVDGFFEKVLPAIDSNTVLIYTSDHGQAMFQNDFEYGHCSPNPHYGEVYVPLFVVTRHFELLRTYQSEAQRSYNRASHFQVFPSLLELMGYPSSWINKNYGPTLLQVPVEEQPSVFSPNFTSATAKWTDVPSPSVQAAHGTGSEGNIKTQAGGALLPSGD